MWHTFTDSLSSINQQGNFHKFDDFNEFGPVVELVQSIESDLKLKFIFSLAANIFISAHQNGKVNLTSLFSLWNKWSIGFWAEKSAFSLVFSALSRCEHHLKNLKNKIWVQNANGRPKDTNRIEMEIQHILFMKCCYTNMSKSIHTLLTHSVPVCF